MVKLIPWELQRPEPVSTPVETGTITVTALYSDGATVIPSGITQVCNADGSVGSEISFESGTFIIEKPAGDYIINIVVENVVVGTLNLTIIVGENPGQSVVTN